MGQSRRDERGWNSVQAQKEKSRCLMAAVDREGKKRREKKELPGREGQS